MEKILGHAVDIATNIVSLEENKSNLMRKNEELRSREFDIKAILQTSEEQGKRPTEEVRLWLKMVEQFKGEVSNIVNQIYSSNYHSYPRLAQTVVSKIEEADSLLEKGKLPNGLVIERPWLHHGKAISFDPPTFSGQSTTEKTIGKIMELVVESSQKIGKIGVYGMGGVGKTTIMQSINNKLAATNQFDRIIWVTVSKDMGSIQGLQNRIAHELGQDFHVKLSRYEDKVKRAAVLLQKLKQTKKFLLILDDLWNEITLEEVGIPEPSRENSCKIVVTTRLLSVCDFIETQANVEVKCLSDEEAWELFVSKAGGGHVLVHEIQPLARDVVRECGGLPRAIITVGRAMRRKRHAREWRQTLNELRSSTTETPGMHDKVFEILRFSYDHLKEDVRKCLLYCAFFPKDWPIPSNELIEYWLAEGFTDMGRSSERDEPMKENRKRLRLAECGTRDWEAEIDKGFKILQELKDACMLEQVAQGGGEEEEEYLRMHNLIRSMAIKIMRDEFGFISKAGVGLKGWPEEAWEEATCNYK